MFRPCFEHRTETPLEMKGYKMVVINSCSRNQFRSVKPGHALDPCWTQPTRLNTELPRFFFFSVDYDMRRREMGLSDVDLSECPDERKIEFLCLVLPMLPRTPERRVEVGLSC